MARWPVQPPLAPELGSVGSRLRPVRFPFRRFPG